MLAGPVVGYTVHQQILEKNILSLFSFGNNTFSVVAN